MAEVERGPGTGGGRQSGDDKLQDCGQRAGREGGRGGDDQREPRWQYTGEAEAESEGREREPMRILRVDGSGRVKEGKSDGTDGEREEEPE